MDIPSGYRKLEIGEKIIAGDLYYSTVGKWGNCDNFIGGIVPDNLVTFARKEGYSHKQNEVFAKAYGGKWMLIELALGDKEVKVNVPMNASIEYDNYLNALRYAEQAVYKLFFEEKPSAKATNDSGTAPVGQEYVGEAPAATNS